MLQPMRVLNPDDQRRFCAAPEFAPLNVELVARLRPDAQWLLIDNQARVAARCSLWWTGTPPIQAERPGLIGHYAARDADAAARLLRIACDELGTRGCTLAVGPIDGNTWQNYRLITGRGAEPTFFLEPDNPDDWSVHFVTSGFTPLAQYYSSLNEDLNQQDPAVDEIAGRLEAQRITIRPLALGDLDKELRRIHELSLVSFRPNLLFTALGFEEFRDQYRALRSCVRPELILVAEQHEQTVGYVFAVPDLLQARRGQAVDTFISKTLATHPELKGAGLGRLLAARCHQAARMLGFRRAIHALMEDKSRARNISDHIARPMRRYALFARPLGTFP
jgi:GNAT superfamily N-acetyltransferase